MVHNRVGTSVTKTEKENINIYSRPNFLKGNLIIWQKRYQEFEWVVYLGDSEIPNQKQILTKNGNNYVKQDVYTNAIYGYPENERIFPETKKNLKYDENHIYETYNFDSI
jgi:hypothetical protein